MKKLLLFCYVLLFLCGCIMTEKQSVPVKSESAVPTWEESTPVEYDVFNLRWGMKKEECYRICDWGGKLEREVKPPIRGSHLLKFEKGKLYANLVFNENDCLYGVDMTNIYQDLKFSSAKDFYWYLYGILRKKYKLTNNAFNHRYFGLADPILYKHFLAGRVQFIACFESPSSEIQLALVPWSVPNSFENRVVLVLEYRSKKIKNNTPDKIDLKRQKDANGL